jgi:hypothetical protein
MRNNHPYGIPGAERTPKIGEGTMPRRIVRTIFGTAAAGAVIAALVLTTAGAAHATTGRVQGVYANHSVGYDHYAGYDTAYNNNWLFRYVATTVPVKACRIAPDKNPAAVVQLWSGTRWLAIIAVFCNGGAGSVGFYADKSATSYAQGAFRLAPRVGDRLRLSIYRNVPSHQDSLTATDLRTGQSQTVRVITSAAVAYHHAFLGSVIYSNSDVMPLPAARELLWTFQNTRVVSSSGVSGNLAGPWSTFEETDQTSGGVTVMDPGTLASSGASFSTYLHAAP